MITSIISEAQKITDGSTEKEILRAFVKNDIGEKITKHDWQTDRQSKLQSEAHSYRQSSQ